MQADAALADRQVQPPMHQFANLSLDRLSLAAAPPPNRTGLPDRLKAGIEHLSGFAMDDVRVHYNSPKPATVQALAYTKGTEIQVGPGQEKHLPHEAWHVVQQKQGRVKPTLQLKGVAINDDAALEREAEAMGRHAPILPQLHKVRSAIPTADAFEPGKTVAAPIQRQLDRRTFIDHTKPKSGMDQGFRNGLLVAIDRYNKDEGRKNRSKRNTHRNLASLDNIEHTIYGWFDENKTVPPGDSRYAMFNLMNDVQKDHKYWVNVAVEEGHQMWTSDTIADKNERNLIDQVWSHIVNGTGAFEFMTTVNTEEGPKNLPASVLEKFKTEVYAMLARLYSRPKGRELLKALDKGTADQKTVTFLMSPIYKVLGQMHYTPYVGAKATAYDDSAAMVKLKGKKKKNLTVVPGKGSGSSVEIAPGVKDASMVDFDAQGNLIPSPAFIGAGHELIHAAHYGAGTYIGPKPIGAPHANVPGDYGNDVEEFLTIASPAERQKAKNVKVTASLDKLSSGSQTHTFKMSDLDKLNEGLPTEAEIRAEHGLSIRHGHSSTVNPDLYRGAQQGDDPGRHVKDAINWITPHLAKISPPQAQQAHGAGGGPQQQGNQIVVDSGLAAYLNKLGVKVAVGSVIGLGMLVALYLKYGKSIAGVET